ncbi:GNAT family N-acetyltransferase [Streptomyces sp. TE5632]
MVRPQWRKQGISHRLHEALLKKHSEDLAVLLVDVTHPKVQKLYEMSGYEKAGGQRPFADSPLYAVIVKKLHP